MLKKKFRETKGSSLIMVIFLLTLFSIISIMVANHLGNQIKSTTNRYDDIQAKYISEAGIERTIKEVCYKLSNTENFQEKNIQNVYLNQDNYIYKNSNIDNIQNELLKVKNNLNSISQKIDTQYLNSLNSKIDSIKNSSSIMEDIDSIRNDILSIAINSNNYKEIENTIYSCIEHIYKATDFYYIEKNKDIEAVPLKNSNYWEDVLYNNQELDALINQTKFGNGFDNIAIKLKNIVYIDKIINIFSWNNEEALDIRNYGEKEIFSNIQNETRALLNYYHGIFDTSTEQHKYYENLSSPIVVTQLNKINSSIEEIINNINKVQSDLNKLYLNNIDKGNYLKTAIDISLNDYNDIKNDLRWLQKKLSLSPLNSDSSKEPGSDESSDSNQNPDSGGNSNSNQNKEYIINLENYNEEFKDFQNTNRIYKYEIGYIEKIGDKEQILEKIDKDIIIQKDNNDNIINIEDIELEVISNAYKKNVLSIYNLEYTIKSEIIFKIDVHDDFKVEYEIKSYERIK